MRVSGYRDRLKQALLNIAINGLEALPEGGNLLIQVTMQDRNANIIINDSGPGIPEALAAKIFQMHFTTKENGNGTGLYVTRLVVESQGGEMFVESKLGQGTSVSVILPLSETSLP
jgi:signal transduction histidine kinase